MRTLTLTAFNRPGYLKNTLECLARNDLSKYDKLYCGIEPGNDEVINICRNINFIATDIVINKEVLGVRKNPYEVLKRAFDAGTDFNVYLEDDLDISPDATMLADYHYEETKEEYFCCCFHNYQSTKYARSQLVSKKEFWAIGFSLTKHAWINWFEPYWFDDKISEEYSIGGIGWDWSIRASILKHKKEVLTPMFSRSNHAGRVGVHSTHEQFINQFSGKPWCKSRTGRFSR